MTNLNWFAVICGWFVVICDWFVVICGWFVVICGDLRWFVVICGEYMDPCWVCCNVVAKQCYLLCKIDAEDQSVLQLVVTLNPHSRRLIKSAVYDGVHVVGAKLVTVCNPKWHFAILTDMCRRG